MFSILKSTRGENLDKAYPTIPIPNTNYGTNNQYNNFPPMMNDGRSVMASWQPGAVVNENLLKENGIQSNWQYRRYLTHNGDHIRERLFQDSLSDIGYTLRNEHPDIGNIYETPKLYESTKEVVSHRQATESDLKNIYLSREQLQSQMVIPSMTQEELVRLKQGNPVSQ